MLRRERGTTLFLTTHYMDEAENCDRIAIIDQGRIIALDTPAKLKAQVQGDCIQIETADDASAEAEVRQRYGVEVVRDQTGLHFEVENGAAFVPGMLRELSVPVRTVSVRPPTLEDVFLKMTGREIRDDGASEHDKLKSRVRRMGRGGR
jgi:ABC-2 type transport system ATP-binding protein